MKPVTVCFAGVFLLGVEQIQWQVCVNPDGGPNFAGECVQRMHKLILNVAGKLLIVRKMMPEGVHFWCQFMQECMKIGANSVCPGEPGASYIRRLTCATVGLEAGRGRRFVHCLAPFTNGGV